MPLCAPPVIAGSVGSNAHQPGAERRPAAKRLYTAKGSNKHILRDISRGVTISQHAEDDAIRALLIIEYQLIERVDIPKLAAGNELYLILSHKLCHMLPHFFLDCLSLTYFHHYSIGTIHIWVHCIFCHDASRKNVNPPHSIVLYILRSQATVFLHQPNFVSSFGLVRYCLELYRDNFVSG